MKKITAALILIAMQTVFCFSLGIGAQTEKISVIVELDLPEGEDSYEYAKKCADKISKSACGFELEYIYDTLICGFGGRISEKSLSRVSSLGFACEVYKSAEYEALEYAGTEYAGTDYGMISAAMVGYSEETSDNLTGDGVKVAVIDNGFDINHIAFDREVTNTLDLESLKDTRGAKRPHAFMSVAEPMELYHSSKIPFAYDYANRDLDVSTTASFHGNHVAGIIGAAPTENSDMHGIAPDCQLILMKIFDESRGSASDMALIAALEDALKLGVNIINLSLGIYSGSASGNTVDIGDVLDKAESMGCIIVSAAGNESVTTRSGITGKYGLSSPLTSYTDYGTVSFPSTEEYVISVASVENNVRFGQHFRHAENRELFVDYEDVTITVGEESISFTEYFHGKILSYAVIPGMGRESDYKGINVKGKLALIERGEIPFAEKVNIAEKMGAVGVIIYNNDPEWVQMELTGVKIPAILISREDGKRLIEEKKRSLEFSEDFTAREQTENGGKISAFSSYGATPSLTLKPDICAVGGNVLSLTNNNSYGASSGTSMAAPQVTGLLTLLLEKTMAKDIESMADAARNIKTALINTAKPVLQDNGVEYSPRVQGAGLVDIGSALDGKVRITSTKSGLPKAELYDGIADSFNIDVTLENITDKPQRLNLGATLTSDGYRPVPLNGKTVYCTTLTAEADKCSNISFDNSGNLNRYSDGYTPLTVSLKAGEVKNISLKVVLDKEYHENLREIFTNGYFVEGFVYCELSGGEEISMPYMGYAGDWGKGRITDGDLYSADDVMFSGTAFYVPLESGDYIVAGQNVFDENGKINGDSIAFSPNGDGNADTISFLASLIRNCRMSALTITDSDGTKVYSSSTKKYMAKTAGSDKLFVFRYDWAGDDGIYGGYTFPDGQYTVNVECYLDYINAAPQTFTYTVIIDTTLPRVKNISVTGDKIKIEAEDENEIYCISIYENDTPGAYLKKVASASAEFDISDYSGKSIYYEIIDCAYNIYVGKISLGTAETLG